jgi:hypothetical protein
MTTKYRIRTYFATLADATAANYVLREGEFWTEKDAGTGHSTGRRKIGDGTTPFNSLPFEPDGGGGGGDSGVSIGLAAGLAIALG